MSYKRKTEEEFEIQGDYGQGWEMVTVETTRALARDQIKNYRENEPEKTFRIIKKRVPIV